MKKFYILFIFLMLASYAEAAAPVAIPFDYYVVQNKGRHLMLSATSDDINFIHIQDPPNWGNRYNSNIWGSTSAITSWVIDTVPAHGILYNGTAVVNNGDTITDPDALYYKPTTAYTGDDTFTYHVVDSQGTSAVVTINLFVRSPANYPMPYGIPSPGFGIDEEPPADPPNWPGAEQAGWYYWDNNDANCTDSNTYGYPDAPRCTIANGTTIAAGAKGVLAPGSHFTFGGSNYTINMSGTSGNESWLVGVDDSPAPPIWECTNNGIDDNLRFTGGHYRVSGIEFKGLRVRQYSGSGDNVVLRYSRVHDFPSTQGGSTTVGLGETGTNVLFFHVLADNNGIVSPTLADERDIHAFVGASQDGWWLIDIMCAENAGDCVQFTNHNTCSDVWVGRMTAHTQMENCVDLKDFNNGVISESNCWDIRTVTYTSGSGGNAQNFYVNDEGVQQGYIYFINNRSWDTNGDLYASANVNGTVYFIGNRGFFAPEGTAFGSMGGDGGRHYYLNSADGVDTGLYLYNSGSATNRYAVGNFIGDVSNHAGFVVNPRVFSEIDYNMYENPNNTFAWGSASTPTTGDFTQWKSVNNIDANSQEGITPNIPNIDTYDFAVSSPSDLIDVIPGAQIASLMPGLAQMESDLNVTLTDYYGTTRPKNTDMDIGAYEYTEGSSEQHKTIQFGSGTKTIQFGSGTKTLTIY